MEPQKMERNYQKELSILQGKLSEAVSQATMWQAIADDTMVDYQTLKEENRQLKSEINRLKDSSDTGDDDK